MEVKVTLGKKFHGIPRYHPDIEHVGQSCMESGWHVVWCRLFSASEWAAISERMDEAWSGDGWHLEAVAKIVEDVTGCHIVHVDP